MLEKMVEYKRKRKERFSMITRTEMEKELAAIINNYYGGIMEEKVCKDLASDVLNAGYTKTVN